MFKILLPIFSLLFNSTYAASMKMIGEKGKQNEVTREIVVKMYDNYYEPDSFKVNKNETIKFIVENMGELVHEYNIATKEMHIKHQPEMQKMVEMEILLADTIDKEKIGKGTSLAITTSKFAEKRNTFAIPGSKKYIPINILPTEKRLKDISVSFN